MTLFLGASDGPARVTLLGAPLDLTESFRTGTGEAPAIIRELSQSLETFSPATGRDLAEIGFVDGGDIDIVGVDVEEALRRIGGVVRQTAGHGLVILLGGEHTITFGAVQGLVGAFPDLAVLHVDAHLDLLDDYLGVKLGHATVCRRIGELIGLSSLLQVGVRSGTREEFLLARDCLLSMSKLTLPSAARGALINRPVYLSIDIDVLDPAYAPGTGYPEPGGPSFAELCDFLYSLAGLRVVAVDVNEVLPALDPPGITAVAAAKLVREIAVLFG